MPHFKAFGMMNLQYEIRICHKIHNKGTMSQWQIKVTIFLSGTDVTEIFSFVFWFKGRHPKVKNQLTFSGNFINLPTILLFIMHSTSNLCKNVLPFIQNAMFSTQKSLMKTVNLLQRNHFLKTYFCTLIFFIAVKARTTDDQRGKSLHCMAENSLPLQNF